MDANASPKAYRSKLKTLSNNKNQLVSHIYYKNTILQILKRRFISSTISKQCKLVDNTGKLMTNSFKRTNNLLSTILFTKDDFAKTTKNLNPNKAHGYDVISILMLKICGDSIWNHALRVENFPPNGKRQVLTQFIKNDKQLTENYRLISLLSVCGRY